MSNESQSDPNQLVTLTSVGSMPQADVIKAVLEGQGIPAFIQNERASVMLPHLSMALNQGGIVIHVRQCDLDTAREFLENYSQAPTSSSKEGSDEETCSRLKYANKAYALSLLGFLCPPFLIGVVYYFFRALSGKNIVPHELREKYRRRMSQAVAFSLLIVACIIVVVFISTTR
mgnify:CR=1 FL=1